MASQIGNKTVTKTPEVRVAAGAGVCPRGGSGGDCVGPHHGAGRAQIGDQVATEAMRRTMDSVPMRGTIVIGEGERDKAPMLYIGEPVGAGWAGGDTLPEVDIAVDPLEGTNLCSTGAPGAITVLAASERGGLLNAPDCYMEKLIVGPSCKNVVDLDAPAKDNLKAMARALSRDVSDLVIVVMDRPRHAQLIAISARRRAHTSHYRRRSFSRNCRCCDGTGVHAVMGSAALLKA